MIYLMLSRLVQVTAAPAGSMSVCGEKPKLSMATSAVVGFAAATVVVSVSLPRMVLRTAKLTNKAIARFPVFIYLRSGETTDTFLRLIL